MLFAEIPGLTDTKNKLIDSVKKGKVAHGLIFAGNIGGVALPLALAFATYLNCLESKDNDACGHCSNCRKFEKLAHPDLQFVFPTAGGKKVLSENFMADWRKFISENPFGTYTDWLDFIDIKQGNIPVEESRQIVQGLSLKSYEGGYKTVIIWNIESMAAPAANALLKILEEPPEKTVFLLVTYDYNRLLPTIQSRVQRVPIPDLNTDEMIGYLSENYHLEKERATHLAFLADGNIREAQLLTDHKLADYKKLFFDWMRYCYAFDISKLVPTVEKFGSFSKEDQKTILDYGLRMMREIYLQNIGLSQMIKLEGEELTFIERFSKVFKFENIDRISDALSEAIVHIERNVRSNIVFMDLSISLAGLIR